MKKGAYFLLVLLTSCASTDEVAESINAYHEAAPKVHLGDPMSNALSILPPGAREPESFIQDGVKYDVHYMRSARYSDGGTTDDEFTPYIFKDGYLISVGWTMLGGPKTRAESIIKLIRSRN